MNGNNVSDDTKDILGKSDVSVQTENCESHKIIAAILNKNLNHIYKLDPNELERKLENVEMENQILKRRGRLLEKRLYHLEDYCSKQNKIKKSDVIDTAERSVSIDELGHDVSKEISATSLEQEFCPTLFKPAQPVKSNQINQRDKQQVPTLMVTPMKNNKETIKVPSYDQKSERESNNIVFNNIQHHAMHTSNAAQILPPHLYRQTVPPPVVLHEVRNPRDFRAPPLRMRACLRPSVQNISQASYQTYGYQRPLSFQQYTRPRFIQIQDIQHSMLTQQSFRQLNTEQFHSQIRFGPQPYHYQQPESFVTTNDNFLPRISLRNSTVAATADAKQPPPSYNQTVTGIETKDNYLPELSATITSDSQNIILTWNYIGSNIYAQNNVCTYTILAFHTENLKTPPPDDIAKWTRIGTLKAMPLPMACTLTQNFTGQNLYFCVLPADDKGNIGKLSKPCSLKVAL